LFDSPLCWAALSRFSMSPEPSRLRVCQQVLVREWGRGRMMAGLNTLSVSNKNRRRESLVALNTESHRPPEYLPNSQLASGFIDSSELPKVD
jgi:hypothetical protein